MKQRALSLVQKVATACLLTAVASMAMGQDQVGCPGGIISGPVGEITFFDSITIDGESCLIQNVSVNETVNVTNSEELLMVTVDVNGPVTVVGGGSATLIDTFSNGLIRVSRNETARLIGNESRNILVVRNIKAVVKANLAAGALVCRLNTRLDAKQNQAPAGRCR